MWKPLLNTDIVKTPKTLMSLRRHAVTYFIIFQNCRLAYSEIS